MWYPHDAINETQKYQRSFNMSCEPPSWVFDCNFLWRCLRLPRNNPHHADSPRKFYTCTPDFRDCFQIAYTPIQTAAMGPEANPQLRLIIRLPFRNSQQPSSGAAMSHNLYECDNFAVPSKQPQPYSASVQGGAGQLTESNLSCIKSPAGMSR